MITKWGFDVEHDKLDKVEEQLEGIKRRLEFLGAVEIAKGIFELTEKFSEFAEKLHVASESAGLTVEEFQKLSFAAGQSAVSQDEMGLAMARLGRHLYDARKGSAEAQKAFALAGFSGAQVQGFRTTEDAMLALSDRFKGIQDPIKKQAIAMELLGRGSINMVGFLSKGSGAIKGMGSEAEKLGVILSHKQVEALVSVEHSMQKLWAVIKNIGATIAVYLAPILNTGISLFLKFYSANKKVIEVNVKQWAEDLAYALGYIHGLVQGVISAFLQFAMTHQLLIRRVFEFISALVLLKGIMTLIGIIIPVITGAFSVLGTVIAILTSPITLIILGVTALVVAVHDLWEILTGGKWEDTWVAKASGAIGGFAGKAAAFLGLGGDEKTAGNKSSGFSALQNIGNGGLGSQGPSVSPSIRAAAAAPGGKGGTTITAPLTIHAAPGMNEKDLAKFATDKHKEHLDRVHREANRSLTPVLAG